MKRPRISRIIALLLVVLAGVWFWARPLSFFNQYIHLRGWLDGTESRWVEVDGYRIHYNVLGPNSGPSVVLVHGLGGRAEDWQKLSAYFARVGYHVYMPDLPGFGRSDKPKDFSYSVRDQAAILVGFLDELGVEQFELGGWSMGGWIAQRVAVKYPDRVRRLILIDSAGIAEYPAWDTRLFTPTTPAELDELNALLMPNPPSVPGFIARDMLRVSKQNAWVVQRSLKAMLSGHDASEDMLPWLKMPVLVVWGDEDHIFPLSQGEKMQRLIPEGKLERFAGCGHLAPEQCASQIGPKLVEFVIH